MVCIDGYAKVTHANPFVLNRRAVNLHGVARPCGTLRFDETITSTKGQFTGRDGCSGSFGSHGGTARETNNITAKVMYGRNLTRSGRCRRAVQSCPGRAFGIQRHAFTYATTYYRTRTRS